MSTETIARRLVELCRDGKYEQAQQELYAEDAVSIEPEGLPPGALGNAQGMAAIRDKARQFNAMVETVHGSSVSEPVVADNWFSVAMAMDVTMKGQGRVQMSEIGVYRVRNDKITQEQFFYDVG